MGSISGRRLPRPPRGGIAIATLAALGMASMAIAQTRPDDIKIVQPTIDKSAATVTLPGAFFNPGVAPWLDVALCGRPSDFLHETVVCTPTTRALLEQAMRDIGCHDADAWADSIRDFPRVRGDRFMVLLEFTPPGTATKATYSLDELLTVQSRDDVSWGCALGPYGFMYKGDPDHVAAQAATQPDPLFPPPSTDSERILHDDPQIALAYKGIQSASQSFADHPLAFEDWIYDVLKRGRNYGLLSDKIFASNGDIPVTITLQKVTEEQLLTKSAGVWHDAPHAQYILAQLPTAKRIDAEKADYWQLRPALAALRATPLELRDANKQDELLGKSALLSAQIARDYAALDAAWAVWAVDHAKFQTSDEKLIAADREEATLWKEHMQLLAQKADRLAAAQQAASDAKQLEAAPASPDREATLRTLRGREIEARAAALTADNKQERAFWNVQKSHLDPKSDPRDTWIKDVNLHVELAAVRDASAAAGAQYGAALQKPQTPAGDLTTLQKNYTRATAQVLLAQARLDLANVEFEIGKRENIDNDPDLPDLKKQRESIQARIAELEKALTAQ